MGPETKKLKLDRFCSIRLMIIVIEITKASLDDGTGEKK